MLLDANILLYAVDADSPYSRAATAWLEETLNGSRRVALPWQTITAFLRIATNPRIYNSPLASGDAAGHVSAWLGCEVTWIPTTGSATWSIMRDLLAADPSLTADLLPDVALAATAIEHGIAVVTLDSDFQRLPCLSLNPLVPRDAPESSA